MPFIFVPPSLDNRKATSKNLALQLESAFEQLGLPSVHEFSECWTCNGLEHWNTLCADGFAEFDTLSKLCGSSMCCVVKQCC